MAPDGHPSPSSNVPTPLASPFQSGTSTPLPQEGRKNALGDYLSAPLGKGQFKAKTYLAGSKALDSLARLIASTEGFFHPSNSGAWTSDVGTVHLSLRR
jgi:proteasome activator subunit 4